MIPNEVIPNCKQKPVTMFSITFEINLDKPFKHISKSNYWVTSKWEKLLNQQRGASSLSQKTEMTAGQ